jgi:hypothetical protein
VDGRFLNESSTPALRVAVRQAEQDGIDAVFLADGPLGDALTMAAAISTWSSTLLLGVRVSFGPEARQASLLARELTTLDLLAQGRAIVVLEDSQPDLVTLWRDMWRNAGAESGAINRPAPHRPGGPLIALDLTRRSAPDPALLVECDLALVAPDADLPSGIDVCQIQDA